MGALISNFPVEVPEVPATTMILNDEIMITNISNNEEITIQNEPLIRMRPVPLSPRGLLITVRYTAQNVCNKEDLEMFYDRMLGKNIRMSFEGYTYYGYLTDMVENDEDVEFSFTYISKIKELEEDSFFGPSL